MKEKYPHQYEDIAMYIIAILLFGSIAIAPILLGIFIGQNFFGLGLITFIFSIPTYWMILALINAIHEIDNESDENRKKNGVML